MSVTPGAGGQAFQEETVDKLKELKILKNEYKGKFSFIINVDGGINNNTIAKVKDYTDMVVSGSYLADSNNLQDTIATLR